MPQLDTRAVIGTDSPACPAMAQVGSGAVTFDLLCWLPLNHEGPHRDERGDDEPLYWCGVSQWEDGGRPPW